MAMDKENEASSSGGFGKDYHGQDVFGERAGSSGIGGDGHESSFDAPEIDTTELSNTESSFEAEAETQDSLRDLVGSIDEEAAEENSNTGSMDTSFQVGGTEEDAKKGEKEKSWASNLKGIGNKAKDITKGIAEKVASGELTDTLANIANDALDVSYKATTAIMPVDTSIKKGASFPDTPTDNSDWEKATSSFDAKRAKEKEEEEKAKTESKAKVEETKEEAKAEPGSNMSKATSGKSDYETKANKDSTKEVPKETPSTKEVPKKTPSNNRNDYGNHAMDTLRGAAEKLTNSFTAKALELKSIEEFAREHGYDPEKLSTMKAYMSYQNKEIMKAIPGIVKQIGSYIVERVKDVVDPSQLPERIRNTLARYNLASLIGAVILSMNSGAGLQASLDQALTMVDPEDQPDVSDYLEDVLSDEGTVNDLKAAFDDALAPQQNSDTNELDESIVNIGRKDNTDYSGFNAGLGTTSDADVKVFIARNVKADPILRRMISKMGK